MKRPFDIVAAAAALIVLSPIFLIAALGIRLSSRGPVLYRATRAGKNGRPFVMHKFRTMRIEQGNRASAITAAGDDRVFAVGRLLRALKIDELPQLYDILRGEMSLVGPRPEALEIVRDHYAPEHWETLAVRPGLASPGSIYNYTHGEKLIGKENPERDYLEKLLPLKLALDEVYVRQAGFVYDLRIIVRTAMVIVQIALGKRRFADPPEMKAIERIVPARNI
ncbi:MAG: sugar transferase [Pirellulales bacterium]|nr:sugar transferase [Pirellulales bacterium]